MNLNALLNKGNRRGFIKTAALSLVGLFYSCADNPTETEPIPDPVPDPDPDPVTELLAKITAEPDNRLPVDGTTTLQLTGVESTPKDIITDYLWDKKNIYSEEFKTLSSGETIEDTLGTPGDYEYKLTVENSNENTSANAIHKFSLYAALLAKIKGTKSEPYSSDGVPIKLDGTDSIGDITEYVWSKKKENEFLAVGTQPTFQETIKFGGLHTYKLEVKDAHGVEETIHDISIVSETLFSNAIVFYDLSVAGKSILSTMNPESFAIEHIFEEEYLHPASLSREPNGTRVALGKHNVPINVRGYDLYTYDLETKIFEKLQETPGISWQTAWNLEKIG